MKKPSDATLLRTARHDLKRMRDERDWSRASKEMFERQAAHYKQILEAIAEGKYPGEQAKLAAFHALAAWR